MVVRGIPTVSRVWGKGDGMIEIKLENLRATLQDLLEAEHVRYSDLQMVQALALVAIAERLDRVVEGLKK